MTRGLWVVELFVYGRWEPTIGVRLTRDEAREEMQSWRRRNPTDRFRLRRYTAPEAKGG